MHPQLHGTEEQAIFEQGSSTGHYYKVINKLIISTTEYFDFSRTDLCTQLRLEGPKNSSQAEQYIGIGLADAIQACARSPHNQRSLSSAFWEAVTTLSALRLAEGYVRGTEYGPLLTELTEEFWELHQISKRKPKVSLFDPESEASQVHPYRYALSELRYRAYFLMGAQPDTLASLQQLGTANPGGQPMLSFSRLATYFGAVITEIMRKEPSRLATNRQGTGAGRLMAQDHIAEWNLRSLAERIRQRA